MTSNININLKLSYQNVVYILAGGFLFNLSLRIFLSTTEKPHLNNSRIFSWNLTSCPHYHPELPHKSGISVWIDQIMMCNTLLLWFNIMFHYNQASVHSKQTPSYMDNISAFHLIKFYVMFPLSSRATSQKWASPSGLMKLCFITIKHHLTAKG